MGFLSEEPREANTEGGVFPAIFGTFVMTLLMSLAVTPFGVLAALYLREYAKQGLIVRTVRIAVNNLAGSPRSSLGFLAWAFLSIWLAARLITSSSRQLYRRRRLALEGLCGRR